MDLHRLAAIVAAIAILSGATATVLAAPSERELLARWAVARCLAHALPDETSRQDAARVAGGYLELGHAPAEAYEAIEAFVVAATKRPLSSITGQSIASMTCTDLVGDPALAKAIARALAKAK